MSAVKRGEELMKSRRRFRNGPVAVAALLGVVMAVLAALTLAGSAASAQDQSEGDQTVSIVNGVDATGERVEVSILRGAYGDGLPEVSVVEAGAEVDDVTVATVAGLNRPTEVMFVLDVANRSMAGGALKTLASSVADAVRDLPSGVRYGLVTAGDRAALQTRLGNDPEQILADLQLLAADESAALHDAVNIAGKTFSDEPGVARSVIVISSGADTSSLKSLTAAEASVVQSGAQVIWVPYGIDDPAMAGLVDRSGGLTVALSDLEQAPETIASVSALATNRLLVSFASQLTSGNRIDVTMAIDGQEQRFSYPTGVYTSTKLQLAPSPVAMATEPGFFGQPIVLYVSVGLAFLAIAAAIWALGSMFAGGETSLDMVLARYSDRDGSLEDEDVQEMLVQTALIRRAVDITEGFAERQGVLTRLEELLERANLPFRAGEGLFFLGTLTLVTAGLAAVTTGSLVVTALVAIFSLVAGFAVANFLAGRRLKRFEAQLPDALQLLAGTLRAGYSLPQGLDAVSTEISDPMGQELRRALTEAQLGRELEDALSGIAERLDSEDFAWAVMAIGIQREVGGNLSEVLMTVSETMIQRERLHREVSALTAEGRVSAGILSLLPPGLGVVMWVMNPDYLAVLFNRRIGLILLGLAVVSGLAGLAWMKKVITIDV